jgi:hypothetical protein
LQLLKAADEKTTLLKLGKKWLKTHRASQEKYCNPSNNTHTSQAAPTIFIQQAKPKQITMMFEMEKLVSDKAVKGQLEIFKMSRR